MWYGFLGGIIRKTSSKENSSQDEEMHDYTLSNNKNYNKTNLDISFYTIF
jgi:hypothetical protein